MAKLVYYYGTMNSSKSANLIMTAYNFKQQGKRYAIVKSSIDKRDVSIKSRAVNTEMPCIPVTNSEDLLYAVLLLDPNWLFVDEVQFMSPEMIDTLTYIVDELNINVIAYGLLTDFQGNLFEGSKRLVETAESIREIKNQCMYCDSKATQNIRLMGGKPVFEGQTVQVGGNESYQSVCRKCYKKARRGDLL